MTTQGQKRSSIITTFGGDIYIINKTPDEIDHMISGVEMITMPNGSRVNKKAIATIQGYDDYSFQVEQKHRHKKGQYLQGGKWNDTSGSLGISAELERITGEIKVKQLKSA